MFVRSDDELLSKPSGGAIAQHGALAGSTNKQRCREPHGSVEYTRDSARRGG
jgi:hypothetical protein